MTSEASKQPAPTNAREELELRCADSTELREAAQRGLKALERSHLYFIQSNALSADDRECLDDMWAEIAALRVVLDRRDK